MALRHHDVIIDLPGKKQGKSDQTSANGEDVRGGVRDAELADSDGEERPEI